MNIDELEAKWADYDQKLDRAILLNETRIRMLGPQASLRRLSWFGVLEIVVNGLAAMLLGAFIVAHRLEPEFWLPAAVLHAGVILHIVFGVWQWLELEALDYNAPVLAVQKKVRALRLLRIRMVKWTLWLSPLLWTPLLIVSLRGILDLNAYEVFPPSFLVANLGFGVLFLFVMIWTARHFSNRFRDSPRVEQVMDHLAGRSVSNALAGLSAIAEFETDQATH